MAHLATRHLTLALLLVTTACTQAPARIDNLGSRIFGKSDSYSGSSGGRLSAKGEYQPAGVYTNSRPQFESNETYQDVYVAPVERADLSAPGKDKGQIQVSEPQAVPFSTKPSAPLTSSETSSEPSSSFSKETGINPWNKKPRDEQSSAPAASDDSKQVADIADDAEPAKLEPAAGGNSFMWPVASKKVISPFGPKSGGAVNEGINIAISEGEPVWAAADGEVVYVGDEIKGYGNMVIIKHNGGKSTTYAHMARATVDKYDRVKQGDIIGYVGSTGSVKSPQLHFAVRNGKAPVDPASVLPSKG